MLLPLSFFSLCSVLVEDAGRWPGSVSPSHHENEQGGGRCEEPHSSIPQALVEGPARGSNHRLRSLTELKWSSQAAGNSDLRGCWHTKHQGQTTEVSSSDHFLPWTPAQWTEAALHHGYGLLIVVTMQKFMLLEKYIFHWYQPLLTICKDAKHFNWATK